MGSLVAVLCNVVNNLPLGLIAGSVATGAHLSAHVTGALLIGVDLGPNLSVTGSLATILWLVALRREDQAVSGWTFLKLGAVVMPPALPAALVTFIWLKSQQEKCNGEHLGRLAPPHYSPCRVLQAWGPPMSR
jgi:Na+/H+ antiporter NhaD/arsenite permease-like protein